MIKNQEIPAIYRNNRLLRPSLYPESIERNDLQGYLNFGAQSIHESLMRSHHLLNLVVFLLRDNTPAKVILEIIELNQAGLIVPNTEESTIESPAA